MKYFRVIPNGITNYRNEHFNKNVLLKITFKKYVSSKNFDINIEMVISKKFENFSVEKKTLSTALGFEPRSFKILEFEKNIYFTSWSLNLKLSWKKVFSMIL